MHQQTPLLKAQNACKNMTYYKRHIQLRHEKKEPSWPSKSKFCLTRAPSVI